MMKKAKLWSDRGLTVYATHDFKDFASQLREASPEFRKAEKLMRAQEQAKKRIAGLRKKEEAKK